MKPDFEDLDRLWAVRASSKMFGSCDRTCCRNLIKAAGGIRSYAEAVEMLQAGASSSEPVRHQIIEEASKRETRSGSCRRRR